MKLRLHSTAGLLLLTVALGACSSAPEPTAQSPTPSAAPTDTAAPTEPEASPTAVETATQPSASASEGPVVVTFRVAGEEEYRVLLTEPQDIAIARRLLAGEDAPGIPNGLVQPGDGGVNAPWSWHIDPGDIEFAEVTTEVCDGLPSHVEEGSLSGLRFCPWSAEVVDIEEAS